MLWFMLLLITWGLHLIRFFFFGRPRYPFQIVPPKLDYALEISEAIVGLILALSFASATHHPRILDLRVLCFGITLCYHLLVTLWSRIWWRARLWNSLVVLGYCLCLWWLVLIYKDAGEIPLGLTFFCAAFKSVDIWLVRNN